jgi:hypothetical protein
MGTIPEIIACPHCQGRTMNVFVKAECGNCVHNGVHISEEHGYEYPTETDEKRTQCEDDGQCDYDSNVNAGCILIKCADCKRLVQFIPMNFD